MVRPLDALRTCLSPDHFLSPVHYHMYRYLVCGKQFTYVESADGNYVVVTVDRGGKYDGLIIGVSDEGPLFVAPVEHNSYLPFLRILATEEGRRRKAAPETIRRILGYETDLPNTDTTEISRPGRYRVQGDLVAEVLMVNDIREAYARELAGAVDDLLMRFHNLLLARAVQAVLEGRGVSADIMTIGPMYALRVRFDPGYVEPARVVAALVDLLSRELRYVTRAVDVCAMGSCDIPVLPSLESVTIYMTPRRYVIPGYEETAQRILESTRRVAMRAKPVKSVERFGRHKVVAETLPRRVEVRVPAPRLPEIGAQVLREVVSLESFYVRAGTRIEVSHPEHGEKRVLVKRDAIVTIRPRPVIGRGVEVVRNTAALAHLVEELLDRAGAENGGDTWSKVRLNEGGAQ